MTLQTFTVQNSLPGANATSDQAGSDLPPSICVRLTRRCNARCAFCQAPDTGKDAVELPQFDGLCMWLSENNVNSVKLSGGEPTILNELPAFIEVAAKHGLKSVVVSNGIRLQDNVITMLRRHKGEFKVSIHHPGPANDLVLGRVSFDRVIANIRRLRAAGVPVSINTVVSRQNAHELEDMVEFAAGNDCRKISFIPFVPRGRGLTNRDSFELDPGELAAVAATISKLAQQNRNRITVRTIDLRAKPYWVVENSLALFEESWLEASDRVVLTRPRMLEIVDSRARGQNSAWAADQLWPDRD